MLIRHKKKSDVASHEITPESVYLNRRSFIAAAGGAAGAAFLGQGAGQAAVLPAAGAKFADVKEGYRKLGAKDPLTPIDAVTGYNNFYEFGMDKLDPAKHAGP